MTERCTERHCRVVARECVLPGHKSKTERWTSHYRPLLQTTATCKMKNLVYLIECRRCKKQYVGETENALHIRLNGHRSDIRHNRAEKPVGAHFNLPEHSIEDLTILVVEKIQFDDTDLRRHRESYWIHKIHSLAPGGLNLDE